MISCDLHVKDESQDPQCKQNVHSWYTLLWVQSHCGNRRLMSSNEQQLWIGFPPSLPCSTGSRELKASH